MVEWGKEAIEAALSSMADNAGQAGTEEEWIRLALDAAITAQGVSYRADVESSFEAGRIMGRAEALEKAAVTCTSRWKGGLQGEVVDDCARAIRAIKPPPKHEQRPPIYPAEWQEGGE